MKLMRKNFQVNAEPFPTGVVWAQIVKAMQVMTKMKTSSINGAINPLYRIMQEKSLHNCVLSSEKYQSLIQDNAREAKLIDNIQASFWNSINPLYRIMQAKSWLTSAVSMVYQSLIQDNARKQRGKDLGLGSHRYQSLIQDNARLFLATRSCTTLCVSIPYIG